MPRGGARGRSRGIDLLLLLAPWLFTFLFFGLFPLLYSLVLSAMSYSPLNPDAAHWIGAENYRKLATSPRFWQSLGNTLTFTVGTLPFTTALALFLALALDRPLPGRGFFRAAFFVPTVISLAVVALVFKQLYAPHGALNTVLGAAGVAPRAWLLEPAAALPAIMLMDVWAAAGYYMLLFLAGLQTVPRVLHEAVALDGGGRWARVRHVTMPHLRPVFLFVIVLNTIRSLQIFVEVFVMTMGGPLGRTRTVVYDLYETAFSHLDFGLASAIAWTLAVAIGLLAFLESRLLRAGRAAAE